MDFEVLTLNVTSITAHFMLVSHINLLIRRAIPKLNNSFDLPS